MLWTLCGIGIGMLVMLLAGLLVRRLEVAAAENGLRHLQLVQAEGRAVCPDRVGLRAADRFGRADLAAAGASELNQGGRSKGHPRSWRRLATSRGLSQLSRELVGLHRIQASMLENWWTMGADTDSGALAGRAVLIYGSKDPKLTGRPGTQ